MALSPDEREQFLAEPHIAALAVSAGEKGDRAPLTVPIWYQYAPGGDVWIMTVRDSRKAALIAAAGRFSLMVDRVEPTIRYVSVEGPVVSTVPATRELLTEIAARYLPADKVEGYVDFAWKNHGEQVVIHLRPERWLSSDLGQV
ncbi:pyridoxamine 5'-phosphate oxidase family protein [Streptomyces sp. NPDC058646]|uniref:pyridoxamine 5'-phosphate oxidase family protein n=1 Tax=Streptomyces sp. NPDC058646 TaxID=3346574 RepID=UPI00365B0F5D